MFMALLNISLFFSQAPLAATAEVESGSAYGSWLAIAAVIGALIIMPRILKRNRMERKLLEKQYQNETKNRLDVKDHADRILVDLVEAGREINAQLDTKMRMLNKLIKDADAVARRLENGQCAHSAGQNNAEKIILNTGVDSSSDTKKEAKLPTYQERELAAEKEKDTDSDSVLTKSGRWKVDVRSRIEKMYKEGREADEIARLARLSVAEVHLVIDLLNSRS